MLLEISGLNAGYGDIQVLWDLHLHMEEGWIVALVGSNGTGKTTLLKCISGLLRPYGGRIVFRGRDITQASSMDIVQAGIIHVPEGRRLFPLMTVEENLLMGAFRRKPSGTLRQRLDEIYSLFPRLGERRNQKAGSLSGGEQQMCAIARGLMSDPELLIIDEMSLGLAPLIVDDLIELVRQVNARGTAVLIVEQDVQLALDNSDYAYVLATGRVAMEGPSDDLLQNTEIKEVYLGM